MPSSVWAQQLRTVLLLVGCLALTLLLAATLAPMLAPRRGPEGAGSGIRPFSLADVELLEGSEYLTNMEVRLLDFWLAEGCGRLVEGVVVTRGSAATLSACGPGPGRTTLLPAPRGGRLCMHAHPAALFPPQADLLPVHTLCLWQVNLRFMMMLDIDRLVRAWGREAGVAREAGGGGREEERETEEGAGRVQHRESGQAGGRGHRMGHGDRYPEHSRTSSALADCAAVAARMQLAACRMCACGM